MPDEWTPDEEFTQRWDPEAQALFNEHDGDAADLVGVFTNVVQMTAIMFSWSYEEAYGVGGELPGTADDRAADILIYATDRTAQMLKSDTRTMTTTLVKEAFEAIEHAATGVKVARSPEVQRLIEALFMVQWAAEGTLRDHLPEAWRKMKRDEN